MIENATAAAGAMWVIDWKRTSRRPMASRASPAGVAGVADTDGPVTWSKLTPPGVASVTVSSGPYCARAQCEMRAHAPAAAMGLRLIDGHQRPGPVRAQHVTLALAHVERLPENFVGRLLASNNLQGLAETEQREGLDEQEVGRLRDGHRLTARSLRLVGLASPSKNLGPDPPEQRLRVHVLAPSRLLGHPKEGLDLLVSALRVDRLGQDPGHRREPGELSDLAKLFRTPPKATLRSCRIPRQDVHPSRHLRQGTGHPHRE